MAEFIINDEDLTGIKGKVVIITGGSSGIGLATVNLLRSLGANVVSGDLQPAPYSSAETASGSGSSFKFVKTNVAVWAELVALFKQTKAAHGRIDSVFANAGIGPRAQYLATALDDNGDLKEPSYELFDVNLKGVINTATLAMHYMREQREGGSIVLCGSATGLQRFREVDYSTAKHGVIGFGRGLVPLIAANELSIRVNILAPGWTDSSVLPNLRVELEKLGVEVQPASAVARGATLLMVDGTRNGHLIYIACGKYKEIDEAVLLPAFDHIKGPDSPWDDDVARRLRE